ncbi:hypothetical protein EYC84_012130 [Monilinia fructicola]|uniref:Uncharacterized protein n=1 Tax=Monilinia fructicola TaxID=38448 RepID=A0A5M9J7B1_MONFR|nr:hypothetical protein EYC84_012130 [Monilinia fructicola]
MLVTTTPQPQPQPQPQSSPLCFLKYSIMILIHSSTKRKYHLSANLNYYQYHSSHTKQRCSSDQSIIF